MGSLARSALRVLIVDDCAADVRMMSDLLKATGTPIQVYSASNGWEALDFLHTNPQKPHVVLLDINMPKMSGHDVLCRIKEDDALRSLVVLMFSSSDSANDLKKAYSCHANGYLKKPNDLDEYYEMARGVTEFWGRLNKPAQLG